jgi:8-oxo-dGTP pyrophosphatase MutT (NUDIX family)
MLVMRKSISAFALIRSRDENGQMRWLARWNDYWQAYNFVGGHTLPNESFRACLIREISEELELVEGIEFTVSGEPVAHLEYCGWSSRASQPTEYAIDLFDVELEVGSNEKIMRDPANRWLLESEMHSLVCSDGRPVSTTMPDLLSKASLWNEPQQHNSS